MTERSYLRQCTWGAATFLATALMALGSSCSSDGKLGVLGATFEAQCTSNADCPGTLICASDMGACVDPSAVQAPLAVVLIPPTTSSLVQNQQPGTILGEGNTVSAALPKGVIVNGRVEVVATPLVASVPGRLIAETPGDIQGTTLRTEVDVLEGLRDDGWSFTLKLAPERPYTLTFFPADARRPPEIVQRTFSASNAAIVIKLPELPEQKGAHPYPVIRGTVHDRSAVAVNQEAPPLGGVRVVAIAAQAAGEALPLPYGSTVAITDSKLGAYELLVPAVPATYVLRLEPTQDVGERTFPRIETDPEYFRVEVAGKYGEVVDVGALVLDTFPRLELDIHVFGLNSSGATEPVSGARVTLKCNAGDGTYRLQGWTADDSEATWEASALPAKCTATIVPPEDSPFGSRTVELTLAPGEQNHTVFLDPRTVLAGAVLGWGGEPIPGALVTAVRADTTEFDPPTLKVKTDEFGSFSAYADPGDWSFSIAPPVGAPYPRLVDDLRTVSGAGQGLTFELPVPHLVQGRVTDAAGEAVPAVTVELHRSDATSEALLGDGITDDSGEFQILISSE